MTLPRRRFVAFAATALALSVGVAFALLLGADLYLHQRAERSAGLNRRGYRGPVVGGKAANEIRVGMLGGSTVFGYGSPWFEAIPALLEGMLNERDPAHTWTALNLGYNAEGVYALAPNLEDFANLDFDVAVFYIGYNDMLGDGGPNLTVVRRSSSVFRLFGYYPILPSFLRERALMLRYGDLETAYQAMLPGQTIRPIFRPSLAARASARVLETAHSIATTMGDQLERWQGDVAPETFPGEAGCSKPWVFFCDSVQRAVREALSHNQRVIVASQPRMTDPRVHDAQRRALAGMMARQFGSERRVQYLDLGAAVDLNDRNYSFDEMHLGLDGNRVIARAFVDPVRSIAATLTKSQASSPSPER
jgi:hypothetical protein